MLTSWPPSQQVCHHHTLFSSLRAGGPRADCQNLPLANPRLRRRTVAVKYLTGLLCSGLHTSIAGTPSTPSRCRNANCSLHGRSRHLQHPPLVINSPIGLLGYARHRYFEYIPSTIEDISMMDAAWNVEGTYSTSVVPIALEVPGHQPHRAPAATGSIFRLHSILQLPLKLHLNI